MAEAEVICVGEALVDFLPDRLGSSVDQVASWSPAIGGSVANVAVGIARLGGRPAIVGVVGEDPFGTFLRERLRDEGVDVERLRRTGEGKTGLVFVSVGVDGERSFTYHRTRSSELFFSDRDFHPDLIARAKVIHCGTNSLLFRDAQRAVIRIASSAQAEGKIVSCDPNVRLHFWPDPKELRSVLESIFPCCTVIKLSEEEIAFATGKPKPEEALVALGRLGVVLPIVTLGPRGAIFTWQGRLVHVPAPAARLVDSTGAGDGFTAGVLYGIAHLYPDAGALRRAGVGEIRELVSFGCRIGSLVVEQLGAVAGLPRRSQIEGLLPGLLRIA